VVLLLVAARPTVVAGTIQCGLLALILPIDSWGVVGGGTRYVFGVFVFDTELPANPVKQRCLHRLAYSPLAAPGCMGVVH
jgi:hypothetical protein